MKQVLIISYFYPPCSLTASARPQSWATYLHQFGYYPTIITRNWDITISSPADMSKPSGDSIKIEQNEKAKIVYVPYTGSSLRDRLYVRYGENKYNLLRRVLTLLELFFQNFTLRAIPYRQLYYEAVKTIADNSEINKVVITANPFVTFYFGYLLKRKFPQLSWVADYRDDWTTTEIVKRNNIVERILYKMEQHSEKKWVGTAAAITSVSPHYVQKIAALTGVSGRVLLNGFSESDSSKINPKQSPKEFIITYNGTLYYTQRIEVFLNGYKQVVDKYRNKIGFKLYFPGLAFDPSQSDKVLKNMKGYEDLLTITERIPRTQVFDMQNESHAFLMVAHEGLKGIPSSKLYEYLNFKKPVILCPDDLDIINETLTDTGLGVICQDANEVAQKLGQMVEDILTFGAIQLNYKPNNIEKYSRQHQTMELAAILDSI